MLQKRFVQIFVASAKAVATVPTNSGKNTPESVRNKLPFLNQKF